MVFLSPCSMMANPTATTPAMLPCLGPKVGACGGAVEGVKGLGLLCLGELQPSVCSPSHGSADPAPSLPGFGRGGAESHTFK